MNIELGKNVISLAGPLALLGALIGLSIGASLAPCEPTVTQLGFTSSICQPNVNLATLYAEQGFLLGAIAGAIVAYIRHKRGE